MVPGVYDAYLAAMATAAAALIGLLFVAVSVRDDTMVTGDHDPPPRSGPGRFWQHFWLEKRRGRVR
jgi:hypothetical protein